MARAVEEQNMRWGSLVLSTLLLAGCRTRSPALSEAITTKLTAEPHRSVYPWSVVAGGLRSPAEMDGAMRTDPLIAEHYGGLSPLAFHVRTLKAPQRGHVSYRMGDRIFWTRRMVTLQTGEAVLTDGSQQIRARCGNRISDVPRGPVAPAVLEPPESAMDQPSTVAALQVQLPELPVPPLPGYAQVSPTDRTTHGIPARATPGAGPMIGTTLPYPILVTRPSEGTGDPIRLPPGEPPLPGTANLLPWIPPQIGGRGPMAPGLVIPGNILTPLPPAYGNWPYFQPGLPPLHPPFLRPPPTGPNPPDTSPSPLTPPWYPPSSPTPETPPFHPPSRPAGPTKPPEPPVTIPEPPPLSVPEPSSVKLLLLGLSALVLFQAGKRLR